MRSESASSSLATLGERLGRRDRLLGRWRARHACSLAREACVLKGELADLGRWSRGTSLRSFREPRGSLAPGSALRSPSPGAAVRHLLASLAGLCAMCRVLGIAHDRHGENGGRCCRLGAGTVRPPWGERPSLLHASEVGRCVPPGSEAPGAEQLGSRTVRPSGTQSPATAPLGSRAVRPPGTQSLRC